MKSIEGFNPSEIVHTTCGYANDIAGGTGDARPYQAPVDVYSKKEASKEQD